MDAIENSSTNVGEHIEERIANIECLNKETMCYKTSEAFIQSFHPSSPIQEITTYSFQHFAALIEPGYVYNIEMHFTTPRLANPLHHLNTRGVLTHVLRHPNELRVFTHAFNLVVTPTAFIQAQSWCVLQKYHSTTIDSKEQWFEALGDIIHDFLSRPYELFAFFGVSRNGLGRICDAESMDRVLEAIRTFPLFTKYIVQRTRL